MNYIKCPKCGKENPAGSRFCNECGAPLSATMQCPNCRQEIPANSVFCPKCGKMIQNDMQPAGGSDPWAQGQGQQPSDNASEAARNDRNFNRNVLIVAIAVAIVVVFLLIVRSCNKSDSQASVQDTVQTMGAAPQDILTAVLQQNNLTGDGDVVQYAVQFNGNGSDVADRIAGLSSLSNADGRSFYKIYVLSHTGAGNSAQDWNVTYKATYPLNGAVAFDATTLMLDVSEQMPQAIELNGKKYFFFMYRLMPNGENEGAKGRVSLNLFDIDAPNKTISLNYDGVIKYDSNGRKTIAGDNDNIAASTPELQFLADQIPMVGMIYKKSQADLEAEAAAEQARQDSIDAANAAAEQELDDAAAQDQAAATEDVASGLSTSDKPYPQLKSIHRTINNADYSVMATSDGSVFGFNKKTRKYFKILTASTGTPASIGFGDEDNIVRVRTASKHFSFNMETGKTKKL